MAYTPRLFTKDGVTVLSEDSETEVRLLWEGWAAGPAAPSTRSTINATLADLDAMEARILAAIGSGGQGTGTNPYTVTVDPSGSSALVVTTGIGASFDPVDTAVLLVSTRTGVDFDPADDYVLLITV